MPNDGTSVVEKFTATQYTPDIEHPAAPYTAGRRFGSGSPEGVINGWQGDHYWDYSNDRVFFKDSEGFGNTGWVLVSGSAGTNNLNGSGSPVGAETPDYVGQWYLDTDSPSSVWISTGLTNVDWIEVVGNL